MCSLVCGCRERGEVVKKETEHVQPSVCCRERGEVVKKETEHVQPSVWL